MAAEDVSDFGSSDLVASVFAGDASFCSGRLAGTVDAIEGFDAFAAGAFTVGAAGGGGRAPVLRWNIETLDSDELVQVMHGLP